MAAAGFGSLLASIALATPDLEDFRSQLAANDSATAVLQRLCDARSPGARILAEVASAKPEAAATQAARRHLRLPPWSQVRYRRVELSCAGVVLSRADNWYAPGRLTPGMNRALETTRTPFGVVVRPLGYRRRPLATETPPAGEGVLRNTALLVRPDGRPISKVVETYTDQVLAQFAR
jgi:hypothetical protein